MENKTKIKYNGNEFLLKQNENINRNVIGSPRITVKKMTVAEKVKETGSNLSNKTKKVVNYLLKPFSGIIKAIKKPFLERKAKKEKIKTQQELDNLFEKNYGAKTSHVKEIIQKLETKYSSENEDFETLRKKNIQEINSIKHKSPILVDPDAIMEHNSEDNSGKPELKELIKKENSVATEILTSTPKTKKLKAKAKILLKTQG
ncbi:MAG: hypothetical protein BWY55_00940 [archaeon ADurb.Bin336]|nr:MAG: hypothetical protein BWY55_00940 [archaeon ADurb.Bin336]